MGGRAGGLERGRKVGSLFLLGKTSNLSSSLAASLEVVVGDCS